MPVIATNTAANTALVHLNKNARAQGESLAKISSGSKIVTAKDDAAGLAVASQLSADVAVLKQAAVNAQNGQALLQIADGGLSQIADILERLKTLTAQSLSGVVTDTERGYIDAEYTQLVSEIDAIETSVTFNGDALLDGGFTATEGTFVVGTAATNTIVADLTAVNVDSTTIFGAASAGVDTAANATTSSGQVDTAIGTISNHRATVGALASRFETRGDTIATSIDNLEDSVSAIQDVDIAAEQTNLTNARVLTEASIAGLAQANQLTESLLSLIR